MTPASFCQWLAEMKYARLAKTDADCARLLGVSKNTIVTMKLKGADKRTALACSALIEHLAPFRGPFIGEA